MYEYTYTRKRISEAPITSRPTEIAAATRHIFEGAENERLVVVALDNANQVVGIETVYIGNASSAVVRVGELFRLPIRLNATRMAFVHNHPTGLLEPSLDDLRLTREVVAAGELLDIACLDHIIVASAPFGFRSLREEGLARFGP